MQKKVTMQDIADHLNISKNSVSQALSGKPGVSETTRTIIHETAEKLGYNYSAVKKQVDSGSVALLASDFAFSQKSFFGQIYLTVEKELKNRGMNLVIQSIDDETRDHLVLPSIIENKSVKGILILSHISTDYINKIIDTGIPTVMIDHHHPFNSADAILLNNRFAAYTAIHHLLELGHKKIGFIGNTRLSPSYQERFEGYRLALNEYGIEPNGNFMLTTIEETAEKVNQELSSIDLQPTAWFCLNDGFGFLVLTYLQSKGIQVPKEVSVCSFDNGQLSQISSPSTTTMSVNLPLYGKKAVEQLFWRMENRDEPTQEILLSSKLIIRDSTGPSPV